MIISPHVSNDNTTTRSCAVWNRPCTAQAPEGHPRFPLSPPPAPNCVTPAVSTTRINSLPGPCGVLRILHAAGPVRTVLDILAVSQHQFPRTLVVYHISPRHFRTSRSPASAILIKPFQSPSHNGYRSSFAFIFFKKLRLKSREPPKKRFSARCIGRPASRRISIK